LSHTPKQQTIGVLWFIAHCFLFSVISVISKKLIISGLPVFEILFFQTALGVLFILPFVLSKKRVLRLKSYKVHFLRALLWAVASALFFYSITIIPIPRAIALSFAVPLFTSIMAIIVLKESVHWRRVLSLVFGFIGMLIIIQPGMQAFEIVTLLVVLAAFLWSVTDIMIKLLSREHDAVINTFFFALFSALCTLPVAVYLWKTPTILEFIGLIALAFLFITNMITVNKSYENSDLTIIMPFAFTQLIFVAIMSYFVFGHVIAVSTIIGSVIIIASTSYIAYREKKAGSRVVVTELEG
jgi:drug/metabolite transporter (DMT)-like permease